VLPGGSPTTALDVEGELQVSIVDVGSLIVFVRAADLGLEGTELPSELESRSQVLGRLEGVRRQVRERLNLTDAKRSNPALGIVSPPQSSACSVDRTVASADIDVTARFISLQPHHAISMTGAMCLGAATRIPGTIPAAVAEAKGGEISIGHPKGTVTVTVDVDPGDEEPVVRSATYFRTACPLAKGEIYYRKIGQFTS
jgi:2-methylaconitate cis-trans-isomerase PrpF